MTKHNLNYYDVLHLSRDAPPEIIRGSYRTMMQQLRNHPDLGGDTATAALINEAYAVLTDPDRRAEYDAMLDVMPDVAQGVPKRPQGSGSAANSGPTPDPCCLCVFCETPHDQGNNADLDAVCKNCGSPLSSAENRRIELAGQRAVERIDKKQNITFYTCWPQQVGYRGHTEDVSLNGLRLITKQQLVGGQRVKIVSDVLEAVANITHCSYERRGWTTWCVAGVSFVTLRFAKSIGGFVSDRV